MRNGVAGDWKDHFDDEARAHFDDRVGDLAQRLGYE
jgi:hypothetical protein